MYRLQIGLLIWIVLGLLPAPAFGDDIRNLAEEFGEYKRLPKGFEHQALVALSYFPELEDERIRFVVRPALVPLTSYVNLFSLIGKRRTYVITISSATLPPLGPLLLERHSFDAQVGIIGHELAHIVDYRRRSAAEMLAVPFCSVRAACRNAFERATDIRTVEYGLGPQLLAWAEEVEAGFSDGGGSDAYLSSEEIRKLMAQDPQNCN